MRRRDFLLGTAVAALSLGASRPRLRADEWLNQMGYQQSDLNALPPGIKDCGNTWLRTAMAFSDNAINNTIAASTLNRDYDYYTTENTLKWLNTETVRGVNDYSRFNTQVAQVAQFCPGLTDHVNFHMLFGPDIYLPPWVVTDLAGAPSDLSSLVTDHINASAAQLPTNIFNRIDVVNEITNAAARNSVANDRGWHVTGTQMYTAAVANGGNISQWIWDAFTQCRTAWPGADLAWVDANQEYAESPLLVPGLPAPYNTGADNGTAFASLNEFTTNNQRAYRQRYEIFKAKEAGVPIDVVGFQFHSVPWAPPQLEAFRAQLWDYNRFGVVPAVTEANVFNAGSGVFVGGQIINAPLAYRNRYGGWFFNAYLKVALEETPIREVSFWTGNASTQVVSNITNGVATDFPVRTAAMLALNNAPPPGSRTLKRGSRIEGRYTYPLWVVVSGTPTIVTNVATTSISGGVGSMQVPWTWYNNAWMPRPISASHLIIGGQFQLSAAPAAGTVLIGYGNANSGTPTDKVLLKLNGATLVLEITVGSSIVLTQILATLNLASRQHRVAVRINGTTIEAAVDGGPVQQYTAGGSFQDQTSVYILSNPDGSGTSPSLSYALLDVLHGPDYPLTDDIRKLSVVNQKSCSLGITYGRP